MGKHKLRYESVRNIKKWDINLPATIVISRFISHFKFHAPCFVQSPRTLLMQLTRSRLPHGTRKVPLSAAAFLP